MLYNFSSLENLLLYIISTISSLTSVFHSDAVDKGFTIFTLSFAEPRDVKTRDEVINQIVQVAFPTGAEQITTFETVCKALAG